MLLNYGCNFFVLIKIYTLDVRRNALSLSFHSKCLLRCFVFSKTGMSQLRLQISLM
jgi:hypothetical protein